MTTKIKRTILVLWVAAAVFAAALLPAAGHCETLRFVFLADSRSGDPPPDPTLNDLINTPVLNAINNQILALSPRPAFVIFGGDMAYRGRWNGAYLFQTWQSVMAPLTDAGIPLYTVIGNHELYDNQKSGFVLANQTQYQQTFTGNPANGPSGYERLVYSFESPHGDAFFAVLDPYYLTADVEKPNLDGAIDYTQLNWLATQAAQTKARHKFLFVHAPYYHIMKTSAADVSFTELWTILDYHRFDFYACGHTHLYSRKIIDSSIAPNPQTIPPRTPWQNKVVQLLNGTCGAPVDTGTPAVDPTLWHVFNAADTYYFSVVDIDGAITRVTSYAGNTGTYSVIDSFTINKGGHSGKDLLLLGRNRMFPQKPQSGIMAPGQKP
jgi:hypothetical protein